MLNEGVHSYLNIREVCSHDAVHDTPDIRDGILMVDLDAELFSDKTASALTTEEVLGTNSLNDVCIDALERHLDGIVLVRAIVLEPDDRPGPLNSRASLLDFVNKDSLDLALVDEGSERVSCVDEPRAARPASGAVDTLAFGKRIPESDIVHLSWLVSHDLTLQAQVPKYLR